MNNPSRPALIERIQHDSVCTLWLNRPEVRNAFNDDLIAQLTAIFGELAQDESVRVVILAAHGSSFCAGADLHWMQRMATYTQAENAADARRLAQLLHAIYTCTKPVIARVQGDCFAGGVGLVAACDIAVASDAAQFCLSEVKLGLVPATISPYVLRAMGPANAKRYGITAEKFDAPTAQTLGLIHEVVDQSALDARIDLYVKMLLMNSPQAMARTKQLMQQVADQPIDAELIEHTANVIAEARASDDAQEGLQAFFAKRKPRWMI